MSSTMRQTRRRALLSAVVGLRVEQPEHENVGFLSLLQPRSETLRGRHILFLNNDVEVAENPARRASWTPQKALDVAVVGSKPLPRRSSSGGRRVHLVRRNGVEPRSRRRSSSAGVQLSTRRRLLLRRLTAHPSRRLRRDRRFRRRASHLRTTRTLTSASPYERPDGESCTSLGLTSCTMRARATVLTTTTDAISKSGKSAQYLNRYTFAEKWSKTLANHRSPGALEAQLGGRFDDRLRILVVDAWVPAHDRDSGSRGMTWLLRLLRSLGCDVSLFAQDRVRPGALHARELQAEGVEVHYGSMSFAEFARTRHGLYDVVILSRPNVAAASYLDDVERSFPEAVTVYDSVDLHFIRESRKHAVLGGRDNRDLARAKDVELDCMRRCDIIAAVTETEAEMIRVHVPDGRIVVLPNVR